MILRPRCLVLLNKKEKQYKDIKKKDQLIVFIVVFIHAEYFLTIIKNSLIEDGSPGLGWMLKQDFLEQSLVGRLLVVRG